MKNKLTAEQESALALFTQKRWYSLSDLAVEKRILDSLVRRGLLRDRNFNGTHGFTSYALPQNYNF